MKGKEFQAIAGQITWDGLADIAKQYLPTDVYNILENVYNLEVDKTGYPWGMSREELESFNELGMRVLARSLENTRQMCHVNRIRNVFSKVSQSPDAGILARAKAIAEQDGA